MKWLVFFLITLLTLPAFAIYNPYSLRSPRGLLMGDAFTAVNDDEYSLFYNPASLGRHNNDLTLNPMSGSLSGTNILSDMDRFKDFPTEPVGAAGLLMDYPIHASAGIAPGFKLFNFGFSFIANDSFDALLRNKTHPMLDLDLRTDRGIAMGFGIPLGEKLTKKSTTGSQTSIGIGAKYIERTGVQDTIALTGKPMLEALSQDELTEVMKSLGQVKGRGWGFDTGIEHVMKSGPTKFIFGVSALDVGGTVYQVEENEEKLHVANTPMQVNLGMAAGVDFKLVDFIASADVRGVNEQMDAGKRLRLGAQVGLPGLKFMAGVNSGYYSYGATLDLFILKVTGGFYDVELGSKYQQIKGKRFIIYLSLFDFSFDA